MCIWGEEIELTCKMDIFALGVLFHQYFTGELPKFDTEQSDYSGEAVAKGDVLTVSAELPSEIRELLSSMLCADPELRPTAHEVYLILSARCKDTTRSSEQINDDLVASTTEPKKVIPQTPPPTAKSPFYRPGNL